MSKDADAFDNRFKILLTGDRCVVVSLLSIAVPQLLPLAQGPRWARSAVAAVQRFAARSAAASRHRGAAPAGRCVSAFCASPFFFLVFDFILALFYNYKF